MTHIRSFDLEGVVNAIEPITIRVVAAFAFPFKLGQNSVKLFIPANCCYFTMLFRGQPVYYYSREASFIQLGILIYGFWQCRSDSGCLYDLVSFDLYLLSEI